MRNQFLLFLAVLFTACSTAMPEANPPAERTPVRMATAVPEAGGRITAPRTPEPAAAPLLATREAQVQAALASPTPIIALDGLDAPQQQAQALALRDPRLLDIAHSNSGEPLRVEVFGVYPLSPADLTPATQSCTQNTCYRVELYNYAANSTILVVADLTAQAVVALNTFADTQPTIVPKHLMDLAAQIALAAPEVREELGLAPDAAMIQQPQMKVQFQSSACERSRQLCVAPIFVWGERALWVIVSLTDYRTIGLRWTDLGASSRVPVTEQRLQDAVVTAKFCEQATPLTRDGWDLSYILTGSDGLRLDNVRFSGKPVLKSAKLVDIHISYSTKEGFGYSDALGCPTFSAAAVVAWNGPQIEELRTPNGEGFVLVQRFRSEFWPVPCNYAYIQRYEFYRDGRFRVAFVSEGRGCGNDGTYRPVIRIAPAAEQASFAEWDGQGWQEWRNERWQLQSDTTRYTPEGYQYRIGDAAGGGWLVAPGQGQFGDGGRSDNAYLYVSLAHTDRDEGESELATLGDCCNRDERQGPERFLTPADPLGNGPIVLWYVPQLKNDDTPGAQYCWADSRVENGINVPEVWPCTAGPMFVPVP